jgi:Dyp-type peroxidase family
VTPSPSDLEPPLDWNDIQGNILGGFNKEHQTLLGVTFNGDQKAAKSFLSRVALRITDLEEVLGFRAERRARLARGNLTEDAMVATWSAIAFSFGGLSILTSDAALFKDTEFRQGLAKSSSRLGDPEGSSLSWKIGQEGKVPDALLIVASDRNSEREKLVEEVVHQASSSGVSVDYREDGHDLSFYSDADHQYPSGREHFGFKDGISQPGIRGILPNGSYLTPRVAIPWDDGSGPEYAAIGKPLVCVGQFLLGYARQIDTFPRQAGPVAILGNGPNAIAPAWAKTGSFLVFRRLAQNVQGFRIFVAAQADAAKQPLLGPDRLAALLVGRWPSGAPVLRSPWVDNPSQADSSVANAFAFGAENKNLNLQDDTDGNVCPVAAHIRKVNPRDQDTDQGVASATLMRRILRRGLPYGSPLPPGQTAADGEDRGLLFLSYQSSIAQQFEFLASQWMNSSQLPINPSAHPEGLGFDMIVGQNPVDRERFAYLRLPNGDLKLTTTASDIKEWITATGGGYFFAPSLSAIRSLASES